MSADAPITKRLIISGLTPSISAEDISRRLATFGTVKAADVGYVTLETTVGKLAKCMNLLSGSTWKGAKLRFGEAKPDFRERIALENQKAAEEPPKKKRKRHNDAVYAEEMSLVTPENAVQRPGWKVSALGRITRPVKMPKRTRKRKRRELRTRILVRGRVIDMTKYGSTHLKGIFLDLEKDEVLVENEEEPISSSESEEESVLPIPEAAPRLSSPPATRISEPMSGPSKPQPRSTSPSPLQANTAPIPVQANPASLEVSSEIQREKLQSLNLLHVGSDIDVDDYQRDVILADGEDEPTFEVVPMEGNEMDVDEPQPQTHPSKLKENLASAQKATLKDLFAPREEEGGFSLLGHLDPDIELDESLPFFVDEPARQPAKDTHCADITQPSQAPLVLDPKRPLFFPISFQDHTAVNKARQRDVFDVIKDNGWNWRDPAVGFFKSAAPNAEEEIKKRWEESKGDLTRDWKRRHREAGKINRRKRGTVDEGEY
ncbi:hypothetical protein CPB84DRAFT_1838383 [Gymnopilus junonius]|uniref:RRM domain-containing protein n=1 Tax=Gymnopilus junonius TaxID=109634 RepID=A0A9P5NCD9_GYMJU|nr:hypothetical protein CPB84DRAFT_1838383 [Gymnopilus junonius]